MQKTFAILMVLLALTLAAIGFARPHNLSIAQAKLTDAVPLPATTTSPMSLFSSDWARALIAAAETQIGVTTIYDGSYQSLAYPGGDVPRTRGVCTDVIIRALRDAHGIDLQKTVHEDMTRAFSAYPANWGLTRPDRNIDHRRVPNLRRFFARHGAELPSPTPETEFHPGDLVTWTLGPGLPHIGIVSDRLVPGTDRPLILHNVGAGARLEDFLHAYPMTGHYRLENRL
ncbi:DUF1287 domain-containing protein [Marimonas arenosa]|uniref:DUF1287 domain-containing protein n=1 Tax=Marimonas arenosa TaxID=1795305 RepID=A0AAE3WAF6_9RHOB|nr:DUF1287 domain-containing protein [Marimonas arenosa]MDQ2089566.1 DUF1287 domain-containing protein [Marimonas arenosa]